MSEAQYDVAVVGAGFAGKVAALRAAELGSKIVLFEAGPDAKYPAISRCTERSQRPRIGPERAQQKEGQ
jgi:flavin-dependent dehydrogenase